MRGGVGKRVRGLGGKECEGAAEDGECDLHLPFIESQLYAVPLDPGECVR